LKVAIKLLFSALLLFFILRQIDINKLYDALKSINLLYFMLALLFYNISKIISAIRLNYYLKEVGIDLTFAKNLKLYYVGMFYNLFLPGGIGGDGYKAYLLKKQYNKKLAPILKALFVDRVSGLVALIFLAALLFIFSKYAIYPLNYLAIATLILIYPLFYLFSKKSNLFLKYFKEANILGFVVQFLQLASALALIYAIDKNLPIVEFLVLFLISSIVSVLPITVGGVGVRELTFLYGLKFINYSPDIGIAFSFLFFIVTLISSFFGIFYLHRVKDL